MHQTNKNTKKKSKLQHKLVSSTKASTNTQRQKKLKHLLVSSSTYFEEAYEIAQTKIDRKSSW